MKKLHIRHWLVRTMVLILVIGSLIGAYMCIEAMQTSSRFTQLISALFLLLYLVTGLAAVMLWLGKETGLRWTISDRPNNLYVHGRLSFHRR